MIVAPLVARGGPGTVMPAEGIQPCRRRRPFCPDAPPSRPRSSCPLAARPRRLRRRRRHVSVVAVLATDQNDKIDPKLDCIAKEIQKTDPKLTGFRIAVMTKKTIAVGAKDDFDLGGDQSLRVAVQQKSDKDDRYQLKITPPQMGDITYQTTCCGKFLPIITPVRTKNNELLIIGVCVQPCRRQVIAGPAGPVRYHQHKRPSPRRERGGRVFPDGGDGHAEGRTPRRFGRSRGRGARPRPGDSGTEAEAAGGRSLA